MFREKFDINKITLTLPDKLEKEFRDFYFKNSLIVIRIAFILVSVIVGLFGYLDLHIAESEAQYFHSIRFYLLIPFFLFIFGLSFFNFFKSIWQLLFLIAFLLTSIGISLIICKIPTNFSYYLGLIQVIASGYFLIRLRFIYATIGGWLSVLVFNIIMLSTQQIESNLIISYNFFYITTNLIFMFASYNIELYHRRNFVLSKKLKYEKDNLENEVKKRTHELYESREQYKLITDHSLDLIWSLNLNGQFEYISPAWENVTGYKPEELKGKSFREIILPEYRKKATHYLEETLKKGYTDNYLQYELINKDGSVNWHEARITPVADDNGEYIIIAGICRNISERKKWEQELINAKNIAIENDNLKTSFIQNMSHELRTPLNGIIGFANLLEDEDNTPEEIKSYSKVINKSSTRLIELVNNILDISRIEAGQIEVIKEEFSLNSLIYELVEFFQNETESKQLTLKSDIKENIEIFTDYNKTYQILTNLIKNAIKFTEKGEITVGAEKHENEVKIFVKDTGRGISEKYIPKIFDRFSQEEVSLSRNYEGAGLGLAICKGFTDLLGGKIRVESEVGKGSNFNFTIPIKKN